MCQYVLSCSPATDLDPCRMKARDIRFLTEDYALTGTFLNDRNAYRVYFETFLKEGTDLLHICQSSGISEDFKAAESAARELMDEYPQCRITVIDSLCVSAGYGLLMETLADMRDFGMEYEVLSSWTEEHKSELHHRLFATDLRGSVKEDHRSKAVTMLGTVFGSCSLLSLDAEGELKMCGNVLTKKKAVTRIAELMEEYAENGIDYAGKCFLSHSGCPDEAKTTARLIEEKFGRLDGTVPVFEMGPSLSNRTGNGTVALFFWGSPRGE